MDDLYQQQVMEHARHPHNFGTLDAATVSHEELNPLCGDRIRLDLLLDGEQIADVRFSGKGCAISQASASLLTEEIKGMSLDQARAFSKDELLDLIGIPLRTNPVRLKCALLSLKAFKMALYSSGVLASVEDDD